MCRSERDSASLQLQTANMTMMEDAEQGYLGVLG